MIYIDADEFRYHGEKTRLFVTLGVLAPIVYLWTWIFIISTAIAIGLVKVRQGQFLGNTVKVSKDQFPEIYEMARKASSRLTISIPDIFVTQNPVINAFAIGFLGKKSIVLNSATVESMNEDELLAIIGHECAHIKAGHTQWLVLTQSPESIRIPFVSEATNLVFLAWSRAAEYTADRGALLACRNIKTAISALVKVAVGKELFNKIDINKLFDQKMNVDEDQISKLSEMLTTHPYIINRIHEMGKFYNSNTYKVLAQKVS